VHGSQNPQRSVTPSWCEASKTFNLKSNTTPANALTTYIHSIKENTHRHPFNTEMQEKLLYYINNGKCLYFTKVFSSSLWLSLSTTSTLLTQNEISKSLLPEGLIERFPPGLPTLINYIQWLSSPASGSRSQPILALKPIYLMPAQRHGFHGSPA
jgi:hypothetical protein